MDRLAEEAARYPAFALDPLEDTGLDQRDAALAHALYDTSVRRWLTIKHLAGGFLRQRWVDLEPAVQAALIAGAAQCLFFDRVPVHAAIDESVEWTKARRGIGASGLVNAVLRKIAGLVARRDQTDQDPITRQSWTNARDELPLADARVLVLRESALPAPELARAAAATGIPLWQIERWADEFGPDDALHLAWHALATGPTLVHAPGGAPESALLEPHESPTHRLFVGSRPELRDLLRDVPNVWVQDPTAAAALDLYQGDPTHIVDLCAGRGTKTQQLLARFPRAQITACEVSRPRLADLERLRTKHAARLRVARPEEAARALAAQADLVVADVPCSNSGVLARRVEARHRCADRQLRRLNDQQREILTLARTLVAPGGTLLYATCSLEHPENGAMAAWAERTLGLRKDREHTHLPQGGPGQPGSTYRDGGYATLLVAPGRPA